MAIKNTEDLRRTLLETLEAVKGGKIDARKASAISGLSSQIISTVRLDLTFMKLSKGKDSGKATPLIEGK